MMEGMSSGLGGIIKVDQQVVVDLSNVSIVDKITGGILGEA